jgi:endonuclease-8
MPEGDTIFRSARTLNQALAGRVVTAFRTALPALQRVHDDHSLVGRTVVGARSVGKHLLVEFSGGLVLRTHMRMSGSWHLYRPGERWRRAPAAMRVVVATDAFVAVAFDVPVAEFIAACDLGRHAGLRALGPDLLGDAFDPAGAATRLRASPEREVGDALLDQRLVAGIGNVFKSEILFACGIHPFRPVASLAPAEAETLMRTARDQLRANVIEPSRLAAPFLVAGRRTTHRMDPAARLWVYGRSGRPCRRCGAAIQYRKQGADARGTYWCPACQQSRPG